MITRTNESFKGIKVTFDNDNQNLDFINLNNQMMFLIMNEKPNVIISQDTIDAKESALNEIFAAHRIFEEEVLFKSKGGEIKVHLNNNIFTSEGYNETTIVFTDENNMECTRYILSTKDGFNLDELYEFHDIIKDYIDTNSTII